MRVMTFNLRFDNVEDGPNDWLYRRDLVLRLINSHAPTILGTQEGMWSQLTFLKEHLTDYELYAPDRHFDEVCQYPTLFVRKGEVDTWEGAEFWLSKTPETPGSKDWDSAFPRMMSYARLSLSNTDQRFWAVVTHLDHMGAEGRYNQAKIIAEWVKQREEPVILMGDFNDHPGSAVHNVLTSSEVKLMDSWEVLGRPEDEESYTHHGFEGVPKQTRMDWILVSPHFRVRDAMIVRDHFRDRYPSDHFPYAVDLETSKA